MIVVATYFRRRISQCAGMSSSHGMPEGLYWG